MLVIQSLCVGYGNARGKVLSNISISVEKGAFVCVIGRNGAGKSTLMRTLCGLQPVLSGTVSIDKTIVEKMSPQERAQTIAIVTTDRVSSPGLTALDVVELGRQPYTNWRGGLTNTDVDIVADSMEQAGATQFANKLFDSLSDGERQRVMIARALAQTSKVMVLDEITAFLDLPGRVEVMTLLRSHAEKTGKIVLLSSHDLELSLELAEQLWIVDAGQVKSGYPKDAIINKAIPEAFNTEEVKFDIETQHFKLQKDQKI